MKKKIIFFALFALMVCALSLSVSAWTCPDCGERYNDDVDSTCFNCWYEPKWFCSCGNEWYITDVWCETCGDDRYMHFDRDENEDEYCAICQSLLDEGFCYGCGDYRPAERRCTCQSMLTCQWYEIEFNDSLREFYFWSCEDCGFIEFDGVSPSVGISALISKSYQDGVASVTPACDGRHLDGGCGCYDNGYDTGYQDGRDSANEGGGIEDEILRREYQEGYAAGYTIGVNEGKVTGAQECAAKNHRDLWSGGYAAGAESGHINDLCVTSYAKGFREGKSAGIEEDVSGTFIDCVGAVVLAPYNAISTMFDFEIFGVNIAGLIFELITFVVFVAAVVIVIKLFV